MEEQCVYVSSRGILRSCSIYKTPPTSSDDKIDTSILTRIEEGDSVYICSSALINFMNNVLPSLNKNIVLVTGDSDTMISSTSTYQRILVCPYIKKWFAQNCLIAHYKIVHIPIGTYYHAYFDAINHINPWAKTYSHALEQEAAIKHILTCAAPFWLRTYKCYSTFHFQLDRGDRREAYHSIPSSLIDYEPTPVSRLISHTNQSTYAFVVSPYGGGYDCHRTWEAIILGCIPIVKTSGMDPLFADLPVLIIKKWSDITQELLDKTIVEFKDTSFNYEKLKLKYWIDQFRINNHCA